MIKKGLKIKIMRQLRINFYLKSHKNQRFCDIWTQMSEFFRIFCIASKSDLSKNLVHITRKRKQTVTLHLGDNQKWFLVIMSECIDPSWTSASSSAATTRCSTRPRRFLSCAACCSLYSPFSSPTLTTLCFSTSWLYMFSSTLYRTLSRRFLSAKRRPVSVRSSHFFGRRWTFSYVSYIYIGVNENLLQC